MGEPAGLGDGVVVSVGAVLGEGVGVDVAPRVGVGVSVAAGVGVDEEEPVKLMLGL